MTAPYQPFAMPRRRLPMVGGTALANQSAMPIGEVPPGSADSPPGTAPVAPAVPRPRVPTVGGHLPHGTPVTPLATPPTSQPHPTIPPGTRPLSPFTRPTPNAFALPGTDPNSFGPGNDMRFKTVMPQVGTRLGAAQGKTDTAASGVAGFDVGQSIGTNVNRFNGQLSTPDVGFQGVGTNVGVGPRVDPNDSPELAKARGYQMNAADAIATGPNRQKIAETTLDAFDQRAAPKIQQQIREVGQSAASRGRIGSGMTAIETLEPFTNYLTERSALSKDLAAQTAEGDIADRQNNLSAFRGLTESTAGLDTSKRGEQRTERSNIQGTEADNIARAMAERDAKTANDQTNTGRAAQQKGAALNAGLNAAELTGSTARSNYNTLSDYERGISDEGRADRSETRTERGYQTDTAKQATEDAIRQHLIEQQDSNTDFSQNLQLLATSMGVSPSVLSQAAQAAGVSASDSYETMATLLGQYMANRNKK